MNKHVEDSLTTKTVLLVNAGSTKKKFILQRIAKLGVKLIILDEIKSWAQPYAKHWIDQKTANHDQAIAALESFLKKNKDIKLDGALTFWEDDVLLVSKIIDKFKLIGIPYEVSQKIRNKFKFRDFCQINGLPTIKHTIISSEEDIKKVIEKMNFPLVIKPAFGASSAFVVKVDDASELLKTFNYIKNSMSLSVESALNDGTEIFVEEYIDGDEVDIDIIIQNGRIKFYAISDNTKPKEPFFIEADRFTPSNLTSNEQKQLIEMADIMLEKFGVQNGSIHFEAKSTKLGPVPIEINLRMGGDEIYSSVKLAYGVDLIENSLKVATGMYISKLSREPKRHLIARTLTNDNSGILLKLEVDERIHKFKFLEELNLYKKIGDSIFVPPIGYEYLGWMMVSGDNFLDAQDNMNQLQKMITYEVAKFHKESSMGKTPRKTKSPSIILGENILLERKKYERIKRLSLTSQRSLNIGIAINQNVINDYTSKILSESKRIKDALQSVGYKVTIFDFNNIPAVIEDIKKSDVDLVFNLCHQSNKSLANLPQIHAIFELLQIPIIGSHSSTLSIALDKINFKKILAYHSIPTPMWDYAYSVDDFIREDFQFPVIIKTSQPDSELGINNNSIATNYDELHSKIAKHFELNKAPVIIEQFIDGDEYDVSIMGNDDLMVLPIARSIFSKLPEGYWHIYPHCDRGDDDCVYDNIIVQVPPKNVAKNLIALIKEIAIDTYNILDCKDYGRVEIKIDKHNNPFVLEINTNPFIEEESMFFMSAKASNYNLIELLEEMIYKAVERNKKELGKINGN